MKVFIFSDTHWAIGRIHRGVMKQLNYEVRYLDWSNPDHAEYVKNYIWCDKCITSLVAHNFITNNFSSLGFKKYIFVSHGSIEHQGFQYDPRLQYGIVSDCLIDFFPDHITPFLMPNGVDPDEFNYRPKYGSIARMGWCGATHIASKQIEWAHEIAKKTDIPLHVASTLSYDEVRDWYNTLDLLLVTAVPVRHSETGPLPAFEAIVSGVPVLGTPVGNFYHVPGPKFTTIEEAVQLIEHYKQNPLQLFDLAKEQYDYVMNNFTYKDLASRWKDALEFS